MIKEENFKITCDNVLRYENEVSGEWSIVKINDFGCILQFYTYIQTKDFPKEYRTPSRSHFSPMDIQYGRIKPGLPGRWWTQFEGKHYSELIQSLCYGQKKRCEL